MTEKEKHLLLLQITDSVFPIGAYSHSYGLETYIQQGLVTNEGQAEAFIKNYITYSLMYSDLPAIRYVYEIIFSAKGGNFERIFDLEERINAARAAMETRTAGNKLATRFIKTVSGYISCDLAGEWKTYADGRPGNKHQYTVSYAVFCALSGIAMEDSILSFAYNQVSAVIVNCVKIIPLSQTAGQMLLHTVYKEIVKAVEGAAEITDEQFLQASPGFELRSMQHEALYSRIYMS